MTAVGVMQFSNPVFMLIGILGVEMAEKNFRVAIPKRMF